MIACPLCCRPPTAQDDESAMFTCQCRRTAVFVTMRGEVWQFDDLQVDVGGLVQHGLSVARWGYWRLFEESEREAVFEAVLGRALSEAVLAS